MKQAWFLLLALSLGLNAGLLYVDLSGRAAAPASEPSASPALSATGAERLEVGGRLSATSESPAADRASDDWPAADRPAPPPPRLGRERLPAPGPGGRSPAPPPHRPRAGRVPPEARRLRDGGAAPPPIPDGDAGLREHVRRMTEHLDLDESQRAAITAVFESHLPRILAKRAEVHDARRALAEAYADSVFDPSGFRALVARLSRAQAVLDSLAAEAMLGEAAVLTPAQRQRYIPAAPWGRWGATATPPPPRREPAPRSRP